jgi:5-methylcytosine-specific restriction enzyme subunit McrC
MEYVFEDFIFGFIYKEIKEVKAKSQESSKYLDQEKKFSLRPDLYLEIGSKKIIADTKYKVIYADVKDPKDGISQNDLYQMLAYAVRFNVDEIKLFYPDTIDGYNEKEGKIIIKDNLAGGVDINVKIYQLPIINRKLFEQSNKEEIELVKIFESTKIKLINRFIKEENIKNMQYIFLGDNNPREIHLNTDS